MINRRPINNSNNFLNEYSLVELINKNTGELKKVPLKTYKNMLKTNKHFDQQWLLASEAQELLEIKKQNEAEQKRRQEAEAKMIEAEIERRVQEKLNNLQASIVSEEETTTKKTKKKNNIENNYGETDIFTA